MSEDETSSTKSVMSSRQAAELDFAFARNGWDSTEVKNLSRKDTLKMVRDLVINQRLDWLEYWMDRVIKTPVGFEPTTAQVIAREIMGENFLGIDDAMRCYGISFTEKQLATLKNIPFKSSTLKRNYKTHMLVAGYPLSAMDVLKKGERLKFEAGDDRVKRFWPGILKRPVSLRWYLIRKGIVPNTEAMDYDTMLSYLIKAETLPTISESVYVAGLYFLARGQWPFTDRHAICKDTLSDHHGLKHFAVFYSHTSPQGIWFTDSNSGGNCGLASMWQPDAKNVEVFI